MCAEATGGILDFCSVYRFFGAILPEGWAWLAYGMAGASLALIVIMGVIGAVALNTWFERRMLGRFQVRLGPNRWGPFGLLQPIADVVKLLVKEDTIPETADRHVFRLAPIVFAAPSLVVFAVIPFGEDSFLGRLNVGVIFLVAITAVHVFGVFMAGWGSRNKYALFGAMRGAAMLVSYEVPIGLALTGVVVLAGSLSLFEIVKSQDLPFALVQPMGFLVFITAALAEISRTPFDMIESDSELGAGYNTEYSGIRFGIFMLTEYLGPLLTGTIATVLFLGGTRGYAPIPGQVWFLLKVLAVVFFLLWVRSTWPRLRVDQIMALAWKGLFPLALLNVFVVATEVYLLQDPVTGAISRSELGIMAVFNWGITIVSIIVLANILGQRRVAPVQPVPSSLANMYGEVD